MTNLAPIIPPRVAAVTAAHPGQFEVRLAYNRPLMFLATPADAVVAKAAAEVGFRPASRGGGWVLPL